MTPHRAAALLALPLLACGAGAQPAATPPATAVTASTAPALVVLVTVDQLRADYLERFAPQLNGGLARLISGGAVFTDAHHDHAITETAPGHATLLAGRFPRSTGITTNGEGTADANAPLVAGGIGEGASPRRFVGTTLVDWLRAADPRSRALSVSVKDRGAILPVGRSRADVYWYSPDGRFTTSRWYRDTLPAWVTAFNARRLPQRHAGRQWTLLLADSAYREPDDERAEAGGEDVTFPHALPAGADDAASYLRVTPFMDEVTTAFALHGVTAMALGTGPSTDVLAISLSSTDYIGHRYGPDSREMHDQVLRIDRTLGLFLDSLYRLRDSSRVVVVLTADHGVASIPELTARRQGTHASRVRLYDRLMPGVRARLRAADVDSLAIDLDWQLVTVDRAAFAGRGDAAVEILAWLASAARAVPGVRRVDAVRALRADTLRDVVARRWNHQLPPGTTAELVVTLDSLSTWGGNVASHGSTYAYDSHVPLIFYGAGVSPGRHAGFVRTVDLAPTLAALARVRPAERLDGVVLRQALRQHTSPDAP